MAQYATPSELASYLQQDLDAATANLVLTVASGEFARAADTEFTATAVTYRTTGTRATGIILPFSPVIAVSAVRINSVAVTGYTLIGRRLYRPAGFGSSWTTVPPDLLEVDLTHGYTTVPDNVKGAVLEMAAQAYANPELVTRESIDDYSIQRATGAVGLTPIAEKLARRYREVLVA